MKFTYGFIEYKKDVFDRHLGPSLELIKNNLDIISEPNIKPAKFFNKVIEQSKNKYIIFSHEDISFNGDILSAIEKSIQSSPDFGVLCIVGKNLENKNIGSVRDSQKILEFCDPCFFVINKDNNFYFDDMLFDDFHLVSEDYCMGIRENLGKKTYTILFNWGSDIKHHSYTCRTVKYAWGKYPDYKALFKNKWNKYQNIKKF